MGAGPIHAGSPASREGLPLRRVAWKGMLGSTVSVFRLASAGAAPETRTHPHIGYSEFGDIGPAMAAPDADVLGI